jgi:hypothetical protein
MYRIINDSIFTPDGEVKYSSGSLRAILHTKNIKKTFDGDCEIVAPYPSKTCVYIKKDVFILATPQLYKNGELFMDFSEEINEQYYNFLNLKVYAYNGDYKIFLITNSASRSIFNCQSKKWTINLDREWNISLHNGIIIGKSYNRMALQIFGEVFDGASSPVNGLFLTTKPTKYTIYGGQFTPESDIFINFIRELSTSSFTKPAVR